MRIEAETGRPSEKGKDTRATRVAESVRVAIIAGDLAPGHRINLNALREAHGISLSPLREAVARLAQERLVLVEDQRGFRTAPVSRLDLCEILDMRTDLIALAINLAMNNADVEWEGRVLSAVHRLRKEPRAGDGQYDFLIAMMSGCGRPMLLDICAVLNNLYQRYLNILGRPDCGPETDLSSLVDAVVGRKKDLAIALLRQWMEQAGEAMLRQWDAKGLAKVIGR
ncbi:MAG: GntR family transcriptional regulator [Paracoccaceae bacterium]